MIGKVEKLKKMAKNHQEKVNEIREWAEIVIDKNNRKEIYNTLFEKEKYLEKMKLNNNQLEIYLNELENE